jgi:hypothetical protein
LGKKKNQKWKEGKKNPCRAWNGNHDLQIKKKTTQFLSLLRANATWYCTYFGYLSLIDIGAEQDPYTKHRSSPGTMPTNIRQHRNASSMSDTIEVTMHFTRRWKINTNEGKIYGLNKKTRLPETKGMAVVLTTRNRDLET